MHRATRLKLYPNQEQDKKLVQHLGSARKVYNHFLALRIRHYKMFGQKEGYRTLGYNRCSEHLTKMKRKEKYSFLNDAFSWSLQAKLKDLNEAFTNFWKYKRGYPNFKRRYKNDTMRFDGEKQIRILGNKIKIPKIGWVRFRGRLLEGELVNGTLRRRIWGDVFISLVYEVREKKKEVREFVGLDINCHNLTLSTGKKVPLGSYYFQKKVRYWSKTLARREKGSNRRLKARQMLAKWHNKATNKRNYEGHLLTTNLSQISDSQAKGFVVEDLNLQNLTRKGGKRKKGLNRSLIDSSLGNILRMLEYKTATIKAPRFFASSKLCSNCGNKNVALKLSDRKWECNHCHAIHDRDINAAINLFNWASNALRGDGVRPDGMCVPDGICLRSEKQSGNFPLVKSGVLSV